MKFLMSDSNDDEPNVNTSGTGPAINIVARLQAELTTYEAKRVETETEPLDYWRRALPSYPMMSQLAFIVLSIPTTSVPCERVLSLVGLVVDDLRTCLTTENVSFLLFLKINGDLHRKLN